MDTLERKKRIIQFEIMALRSFLLYSDILAVFSCNTTGIPKDPIIVPELAEFWIAEKLPKLSVFSNLDSTPKVMKLMILETILLQRTNKLFLMKLFK